MKAVKTKAIQIDIQHLTRAEGHGNIVVDFDNGELNKCALEIVEAPRFFEALMRGKPYQQASHIASRICGICAVTHATASLRASEKALGIVPSPQTTRLRKLNILGEMLDSHILHVYMLVAPDLLEVGSVIPLASSAPELVLRALKMKKVAGDLCQLIGGRHTHPISMVTGGFTHYPSRESLVELYDRLVDLRHEMDATVDTFQDLHFPEFENETEYLALHTEGEYCLIDGEIISSDGGSWPVEEYLEVTNETVVHHSTAKHSRNQRRSYLVGALARFNTNFADLHPKARSAASALDLKPKCVNPYLNTVAQIVEMVHFVEEAIAILTRITREGLSVELPVVQKRPSGEGVGACEAPRGTLYHHYAIQDETISFANCITPTAQNLANIEADMRALVPQFCGQGKETLSRHLEMLVRAYDPCISCSTHALEVRFI